MLNETRQYMVELVALINELREQRDAAVAILREQQGVIENKHISWAGAAKRLEAVRNAALAALGAEGTT
jgi:hypothetical protein